MIYGRIKMYDECDNIISTALYGSVQERKSILEGWKMFLPEGRYIIITPGVTYNEYDPLERVFDRKREMRERSISKQPMGIRRIRGEYSNGTPFNILKSMGDDDG